MKYRSFRIFINKSYFFFIFQIDKKSKTNVSLSVKSGFRNAVAIESKKESIGNTNFASERRRFCRATALVGAHGTDRC